jgi:hypothetical protein
MFDQNQNDLIKSDVPASMEGGVESETKADRAATEDELKDLEISLSFEKIELIKKTLADIQNNITRVMCLLGGSEGKTEFPKEDLTKIIADLGNSDLLEVYEPQKVVNQQTGERVIEGVFNGQNMIGADGKEYLVPANYASKSKLVEGDILKLVINSVGAFIYKQIGPIERSRIVGTLVGGEDEESYAVEHERRKWRILTASVTYFKGNPGDEAVILVPKNTPSRWAAVENIIKKSEM